MKNSPITFVVAGVLAVIFASMLFTFQVRQTEIAVVTTLGKYTKSISTPGFNFRLPWPIQKIYKFDNRIQYFESKFEQAYTRDALNVLVSVYAGWKIADPKMFLESLAGDFSKANKGIEPLIRNAKNGVLSKHLFAEIASTNIAQISIANIEREILDMAKEPIMKTYGIELKLLGIKQLGLPESITSKVFDRMRAERQTRITQFQTEGEKQARIIRAEADSTANKILAEARATAIELAGGAEAKASEAYKIMQQEPDLANFFFQRKALEQVLTNRTTLILDKQTPPFTLLNGLFDNQTIKTNN